MLNADQLDDIDWYRRKAEPWRRRLIWLAVIVAVWLILPAVSHAVSDSVHPWLW